MKVEFRWVDFNNQMGFWSEVSDGEVEFNNQMGFVEVKDSDG